MVVYSSKSSRSIPTKDLLPQLGPARVYGSRFKRVMQGSRAPSGAVLDHGDVISAYRDLTRHRPPERQLVLLSHSAAWALGARFATPDDPVSVGVSGGSRPRNRDEVSTHRLSSEAPLGSPTGLGATTDAAWTALDLARGLDRRGQSPRTAVCEVDALLRATGCSAATARALAAEVTDLRRLPRARRVLDLARDGVDSFPETRLRLLLVDGGLPEPVVQCPVHDEAGNLVANLDLGWPEIRVGVEYDGAVHRGAGQHSRDLRRHNILRRLGWVVLQIDAAQLRNPTAVLHSVRAVVAGRRPR